jgi:tRNA (cytidine/uridine-2'-O-)-methyltransferase
VFRIVYLNPQIGPNTGNAIRTAAATGCELHLIKPLGFEMTDRHLRRAGLDYHDLASVTVHEDLDAAWAALTPARVYAFSAHGTRAHSDIAYQPGDVLLFGCEQRGLPPEVLADSRVTAVSRIPMLPARRSLNLANATAVVAYEAWRQQGYRGAAPQAPADGEFV